MLTFVPWALPLMQASLPVSPWLLISMDCPAAHNLRLLGGPGEHPIPAGVTNIFLCKASWSWWGRLRAAVGTMGVRAVGRYYSGLSESPPPGRGLNRASDSP